MTVPTTNPTPEDTIPVPTTEATAATPPPIPLILRSPPVPTCATPTAEMKRIEEAPPEALIAGN